MASEFGLDADRLSALNLFYEFVENTPGADERYHVRGGNDQILYALAAQLPDGTVRLDAPLEALSERGDGSYGMRFGGVADEVIADRVVLALPVRDPPPGRPRRRGPEREEAPLHRRARDGHEREGADAVRPPPAGLRPTGTAT